MFEARNSVADRLLHMFALERHSGRSLAATVHGVLADEDESGGDKQGMGKFLMGVAGITASIMGLVKAGSHVGPDGMEVPSMADKGTDWVKDQFKSNDDKQQEKAAVGTSVGPSPLANPDDVKQSRVKTAKADESSQDAIRDAANQQSVDYALLYAVAGAESSFRADAGASTSSAVGMFQFTESTWKYLCKQYNLDFTSEDRRNARKSAQVAGLFVRSITETIQRNMGRKPTYGEVYMGYFLGPTGAVRFLKAAEKNPDASGADLFPKAAAANPNVFYNKGDKSQPLTLRQILAKQEGKILSYAKDADPNQAVASSPISAAPIQVALTNPDQKSSSKSGGDTASPSPLSSRTSSGTGGGQRVVGVQSAQEVVSNYQETAPTPIETQEQQQSSKQASSVIIPEQKNTQQQTTLVRGRDGRVYVLNS